MINLVDLSQDLYDKVPNFACDPQTAIFTHLVIEDRGYNNAVIVTGTHQGTHMDAPYHFFDDGKTIDQVDIKKGFGPAWVLDFTHKKPKEEITAEDLEIHKDKIIKGSRILFHTGWDKVFPEKRYFSDQPFLGIGACQYLADKGVACLGIDAPTIYPEKYKAVHHILLNKDTEMMIIESLMHLEKLENDHIILIAFPLRITKRDGAPTRAIAIDGDIDPFLPLMKDMQYK